MPPYRRVRISDENRADPITLVTDGASDPALVVTSGPSDPVRIVESGRSSPTRLVGGHSDYCDKILGYNPIAFWPLDEVVGGTALCMVNGAQSGTYQNVALYNTPGPDAPFYAPFFNGIDSLVDVLSAPLLSAFDGDEGTIMCWYKAFDASDWGVTRSALFIIIDADTTDYVTIQHPNVAGQFVVSRLANGGGVSNGEPNGWTPTDWQHVTMRYSKTGDSVIYYRNGVQPYGAGGDLNFWTGAGDHTARIGMNIFPGVAGPYWWHGWIQYVALWDSALAGADIADLATID
jgi:hypothetical protein